MEPTEPIESIAARMIREQREKNDALIRERMNTQMARESELSAFDAEAVRELGKHVI